MVPVLWLIMSVCMHVCVCVEDRYPQWVFHEVTQGVLLKLDHTNLARLPALNPRILLSPFTGVGIKGMHLGLKYVSIVVIF